jgi:antitoxin (DNA-binding transcriptional repressor) of toxin-antitoxin stability system
MRRIGAARFKEQCLALLDRLTPEGLVITKHGKPVAGIIPYSRPTASLIGCLRGKMEINGYLLSTGTRWDVDAES